MKAIVLNQPGTPLVWTELSGPQPGPGEIRVRVLACGVCRTDLHVLDGELPDQKYPIIPGPEIVGRIDSIGAGVEALSLGERVAFPGSATRAGTVPTAGHIEKIYAITRYSPDLPATAALQLRRLQMRASLSRLARSGATSH